jgi:hypothetical protein
MGTKVEWQRGEEWDEGKGREEVGKDTNIQQIKLSSIPEP